MLFYLSIISIYNLVLMALFLFIKKRKNKIANIFLGLANIEVAYIQIQLLLFDTNTIENALYLINLDTIIFYILGGTLYMYVYFLTNPTLSFSKKQLLHIVPALPGLAYFIYFQLKPNELKIFYLHAYIVDWHEIFIMSLGFCILITYLVLAIFKLRNHEKSIKQFYSNIDKIRIKWAHNMLRLFLVLCIGLGPAIMILHNSFSTITIGLIGINIVFLYVFINILFQPVIIYDPMLESTDVEVKQPKQITNSIDEEKFKTQIYNIEFQLVNNKLYLNSGLTLKDLADATNLTPHQLSQIINQSFGKSFFDLVNSYRVNEAIEMLNHPNKSNYTFETIAQECGFGTRASLINSFKKVTGKTPSEFRKNITN